MNITIEIVVVGAVTGLTYSLLAAGIVLIFRSAHVINLAQGQIGAIAALILSRLVLDHGWNYFVAFAFAILIGAGVGTLVELAVVRRLFSAPRVTVLIATIGVAQLLLLLELLLPKPRRSAPYPSPLDRRVELGDLILRSEHFMTLAFIPAAVVGLTIFLTRTPLGLAVRAGADNRDAATLSGISPKRISTTVWAIAGVLSALSAILVIPLRSGTSLTTGDLLGPNLLVRALAAALVGGLVSIPRTVVAGIAIGIIEAVTFFNVDSPSIIDAMLFGGILLLLLFAPNLRRSVEPGSEGLALTPRSPRSGARAEAPELRRALKAAVGAVVAAFVVVLPLLFGSSGDILLFSQVIVYAMVALSVTVLTGWGGQLSLGQFAFVGLGALFTARLVSEGVPYLGALAAATVLGAIAALVIGFPALRVRGVLLAIATLAFAVACSTYFFSRAWVLGGTTRAFLPRASILGIELAPQRSFYYFVLVIFLVVVVALRRLRKSGIGRSIIAVRENEAAASSFGLGAARTKLMAFGLSGAIASLSGGLLGGLYVQFSYERFVPTTSLNVIAMAVIGGMGSILGAILGAVYVVGLPAIFGSSTTVTLATSGLGLLVLLMYFPGGLVQIVNRGRDVLAARFAGDRGATPVRPRTLSARSRADAPVASGQLALRTIDVAVRFGGVVALDGVSIEVRHGETIGLIGTNGAGKSTLMNVVSGLVRPTHGRIEILGVDATTKAVHERALLGVGRLFQSARLFPDLSVRETVQVALETSERSHLASVIVGSPRSRRVERTKALLAEEYISFMGLGRYADHYVADLSTGTRRIVELTCLVAQAPRLMLLDEPTAGVAQRETEAFGPLLQRIQRELDASLVIIEHDMPLVMSISDRVYCLSSGQVIAHGAPEAVRADPAVIASYLGTDERAIQRSGPATAGL